MALMDAYGLELVSVEAWGFIWGFLSTGFIIGGLIVAKVGLGPTPVKVLVFGNLVNWTVCSLFTVQSSIVLLTIGTFIWITMRSEEHTSALPSLMRILYSVFSWNKKYT